MFSLDHEVELFSILHYIYDMVNLIHFLFQMLR